MGGVTIYIYTHTHTSIEFVRPFVHSTPMFKDPHADVWKELCAHLSTGQNQVRLWTERERDIYTNMHAHTYSYTYI